MSLTIAAGGICKNEAFAGHEMRAPLGTGCGGVPIDGGWILKPILKASSQKFKKPTHFLADQVPKDLEGTDLILTLEFILSSS